mgnify:CR=1 FL=1
MIADGVAPYASPLFLSRRAHPTLLAAWGGVLAYTFQLYFDFSGYSDMAIGLSRVFGVQLPLNFDSPYKALNIIEFWRRWHMTLSRFLRDYLYISLGGNRKGPARTLREPDGHHAARRAVARRRLDLRARGAVCTACISSPTTAGWRCAQRLGQDPERTTTGGRVFARAVTFVAIVVAWVFFRATSLDDALAILRGMVGLNGVSIPATLATYLAPSIKAALDHWGVAFPLGGGSRLVFQYSWIVALLPLVMLAPNTQEILGRFQPALNFHDGRRSVRLSWQPTPGWAAFVATLTACGLLSLTRVSEFLYYQF